MCAQISKKECNHTQYNKSHKKSVNYTTFKQTQNSTRELERSEGGSTTASTCIEIHKIKLRRSHNDEQNKVAQNFTEHSTMECQGGKRKKKAVVSGENGRKETIAGEVK